MKPRVRKRVGGIFNSALALLIAIGLFVPAQLSAQSLQRIFSTPAVRAELDRLRLQIESGVVLEDPVEEPGIEIPVFTEDVQEIVYELGGSMRKSDGSYTVWINDVAYDQGSLPSNMELLSPFSQGRLRIHDVNSDANFYVKPGQVLNLTTGQLYESYQYQAVLRAAEEEAARLAMQEATDSSQNAEIDTDPADLDGAAPNNVLDATQGL